MKSKVHIILKSWWIDKKQNIYLFDTAQHSSSNSNIQCKIYTTATRHIIIIPPIPPLYIIQQVPLPSRDLLTPPLDKNPVRCAQIIHFPMPGAHVDDCAILCARWLTVSRRLLRAQDRTYVKTPDCHISFFIIP